MTERCRVAAAVGGREAERGEHAAGARAEDPRDAELVGDRGGVQRPGAAERQQREAARVDAALDRHDAQRADHLRVRDAHDARGALAPPQAELGGERADRRASPRSRVERDAAGERPRRVEVPSTRLASVTVGSVPPRP